MSSETFQSLEIRSPVAMNQLADCQKWEFLEPNMECGHLLGFLIIALSYNVTVIGKIWLTLVILLRFMVIYLAAYPLYQDEQGRFICNTLQPGCPNVCYDIFAPVSHIRFWLIQTISVLLLYAVFCVCVLHSVVRQVAKEYSSPDHRYKETKEPQRYLLCHRGTKKSSKGTAKNRIICRSKEMGIPDFSRAYAIQLLLRIVIEVGFGVGHYYLLGFSIPRRFSCSHSPCPSSVDCYISRPTEKSIMMLFLWALSGVSLLLSLVDLVFAFRTNAVRNQRKKLLWGKFATEEKGSPGLYQANKPNEDSLNTAITDNCLLGGEGKERHSLPLILTPQQKISANLNCNSNKPCIAAANPEARGAEHLGTLHELPRYEQQPGPPKGALPLKSQDGCHHRSHSAASYNKPSVHYSVLERKASDVQSVCSGDGGSRSKKSDWV